MSGIAGILLKQTEGNQDIYQTAFSKMLGKLIFSNGQLVEQKQIGNIWFANALPISQKQNENFLVDSSNTIFCVVDGMVLVNDSEKSIVKSSITNPENFTDHDYIPYLYSQYGSEIVHHITGWYNIFIYDSRNKTALLFNDRLGYLPLYFSENDRVILFSSKIESILASGLMERIEIDQTTLAEHLLFNYPLSNHTYIKGIKTLEDASLILYNGGSKSHQKYWEVDEFFGFDSLSKKQSMSLIDNAFRKSVDNLFNRTNQDISFSLTGGWDSRVVLSHLIPHYKNRLKLYSFGASQAPDIQIPTYIAQQESLNYAPFVLDEEYLKNHFLRNAVNSIILSNGTRGYKRAHYHYAIEQLGLHSPWLLTGIYGDEVFKVGRPQGGEVISENSVELIASKFNPSTVIKGFKESDLFSYFGNQATLLQELENRIEEVGERFNVYTNSGERYFAFRFTLNLRKYFGYEVNSYNDFVWCHSPFIDYDVLKAFAQTPFMPSRYEYIKPKLQWQMQTTWLYYKMTEQNYPALTEYPSARGFSMKDSATLLGMFKIANKKFFNKSGKLIDAFNTIPTDKIFKEYLQMQNNGLSTFFHPECGKSKTHLKNSLEYWLRTLTKLYI